jgi:hybrid polyketide synthase/nonribosomal peptide synthetase FtdB
MKQLKPNRNSKSAFLVTIEADSDEGLTENAKKCICYIRSDINNFQSQKIPREILCPPQKELRHRVVIKASSEVDLLQKLQHVIEKGAHQDIFRGLKRKNGKIKTAFVYSGMGPQWWGMGRQLYMENDVFRETINECDEAFRKIEKTWSIKEQINCTPDKSGLYETQFALPVNLSLQIALTRVIKKLGIKPDAVTGHSTGELTACYEAGVFSLEDALKIAYIRGTHQKKLSGAGGLLTLNITASQANDIIEKKGGSLSLAAVNSNNSVTLAGTTPELEKISDQYAEEAMPKFLKVNVPYHSRIMDQIKDDFIKGIKIISPKETKRPLYSTVKKQILPGSHITPYYLWENIRQPVLFSETISLMIDHGYNTYLEIGPHPVLMLPLSQIGKSKNRELNLFYTMRRDKNEVDILLNNIFELICL